MEYGYIRVSSKEQNIDRQLDAFNKMNLDRKNIFIDKQSGKDFERPAYHEAIEDQFQHKERVKELIKNIYECINKKLTKGKVK